jgi:hypothetical protein
VNDELALPDAPLPACLAEYEPVDWDGMESKGFTLQRKSFTRLAQQGRDAKTYLTNSLAEIAQGAAGASLLQTIAHMDMVLPTLTEEVTQAVNYLKTERENIDVPSEDNKNPRGRYMRLLAQTQKSVKELQALRDGVMSLAPPQAEVVQNNSIGTYVDLRGSKQADKPIPADIVSEAADI